METLYLKIAEDLLGDNGLSGWKVTTSRGKRTIGLCSYQKKTIYISEHHIRNSPHHEIMDTVFHEVAHAMNPMDSHGPKWKATAQRLGGTGEQYHELGDEFPSKWKTMCINGHETKVFRWNQKTIYTCHCGGIVYILRTDGEELNLSHGYVTRFNSYAEARKSPQIDSTGRPQI